MKVLMVTPSYYPIKGGAESVVHDLSVKLNNIGVKTDIITFNMERKWKPYWRGKVETDEGIIVYRIPALNWCPVEYSDRITFGINYLIPGIFRGFLKNYDILHFHGPNLSFPLFSYGVDKPRLLQFHGFRFELFKRYVINRLILKKVANIYLCLTNYMKKELMSLGIDEEKIRVVPNGIDTTQFYPLGKKDENLALFVGRICPEKGLFTLLKSLNFLETPINLAIIGPADWNSSFFNDMMELIKRENAKGRHKVIYVGEKNRSELIEWYRKATFLVLPSYREGFPVVILEALACETPVIATNISGIPEILKNNSCGFLVPPTSPRQLAEAMQFLLDNKDVRAKFGSAGRIIVKERFSLDSVANKFVKVYKETLSKFSG